MREIRKASECREVLSVEITAPAKQVLKIYRQNFRRYVGSDPVPPLQRADLVRLEKLVQKYSVEELEKLLQTFFSSDLPFIRRQGYALGVFITSDNVLRMVSRHMAHRRFVTAHDSDAPITSNAPISSTAPDGSSAPQASVAQGVAVAQEASVA